MFFINYAVLNTYDSDCNLLIIAETLKELQMNRNDLDKVQSKSKEIEDIPNGSGKVSVKVKQIPMTPKEFCEDLDIPDFSVDKWCLRNQVLLIYNDE
ncbi:uncharacterized protein LOC113553303 isoform X2 [Rhopalosiphum maidis]|uniref:uncharacterized protein LOC113553303 isoform X2 n=1 Tax=Rhopalosiphum maidis TaxID=43146 RepID=UPI000EFED70A|nr:uncharacterized protein LOC113553303 isoform X2 [Rhopalosiphum maidis]